MLSVQIWRDEPAGDRREGDDHPDQYLRWGIGLSVAAWLAFAAVIVAALS